MSHLNTTRTVLPDLSFSVLIERLPNAMFQNWLTEMKYCKRKSVKASTSPLMLYIQNQQMMRSGALGTHKILMPLKM